MVYYANENSQYIQHYGVLGMKWGQHRYKSMIKKSNKMSYLYLICSSKYAF